jgi:hypothetical protein
MHCNDEYLSDGLDVPPHAICNMQDIDIDAPITTSTTQSLKPNGSISWHNCSCIFAVDERVKRNKL